MSNMTLRQQIMERCSLIGLCRETAEAIADDAIELVGSNRWLNQSDLLDVWGEVVRAGESP